MDITIEGKGFGDAEVFVDGDLTYELRDADRSFNSTGEHFLLIGHYTGDTIGIIRPHDCDPIAQIRALIEENDQ